MDMLPVKSTGFKYVDGLTYTAVPFTENVGGKVQEFACDCPESTLFALIKKRLLSDVDIEILQLLFKYKFLNYYNIAYYLDNVSTKIKRKKDYSSNLARLRRNGLIVMYSTNTEPDCLRCYTLSSGGFCGISFFNGYKVEKKSLKIPSVKDSVKALAINQFAIMALSSLQTIHVDLKKSVKNYPKFDAVITLPATEPFMKSMQTTIVLMCVRRYPDWQSYIKLGLINYIKASKTFKDQVPIIVILAEDYDHMLEISETIIKEECEHLMDNILFTNDIRVVNKDLTNHYLFDKFYSVAFDPQVKKIRFVSKKIIY